LNRGAASGPSLRIPRLNGPPDTIAAAEMALFLEMRSAGILAEFGEARIGEVDRDRDSTQPG
jgi:hypothetical protein